MDNQFQKVKEYLLELGHLIVLEDEAEGVLVVDDEEIGIKSLVIGCADPILIMEQYLFDLPKTNRNEITLELLKKNRDIVHGAFAIDEEGHRVIFRDTLQIENLDLNELEASINSLGLLLTEMASQLIEFAKADQTKETIV